MRPDLPVGTVTFLFTDVEGSTKLLHQLGADGYAQALAEHRRVLREAFSAHGGVEVDTQGDAFFAAFATAPGALRAAAAAREALAPGPIRVRVGLHTGTPRVTEEGYVGADVHRAARIAACGHGGQVLVSASTAALVGLDSLRDLGLHRLKDLSAPERIYQLGDHQFPPLRSLDQTNLPVAATPFLGRERELNEVVGLLSRADVRLLTLTGPGGTGKTRLATQTAAELLTRYPHGVWWVPLAALRDAGLVLATAAHAVGAKDGLAEHIADQTMLLLFDNFEQVIEAAGDVAGLLASCPNVDLLVTSREPLHVSGEHEYPVPPLEHEDGVRLFLARARAVKPDLVTDAAVSEICRRLDDLPLALELAAARVKALSVPQILARLEQRLPLLTGGARDLPERQRTLRTTIAWSYELLKPDEQRLFARLAVFRGGCTLETAEDVADADLDTLQSLVDKSLLRQRGDRSSMLETIREYAGERLREGGEEATIRDRHLDHFVALAERAYEERIARASEWFPVLEAEHDNLRAALDWARTSRPRAEAQLAGAVAHYWGLRGHAAEARERVSGALARYASRDRSRARALTHLGEITDEGRDALRHLDEALLLSRELGDATGEALALESIGHKHIDSGAYPAAKLALEQSLSLRQQAGAPELESARGLHGLCHLLVALGEIERAEPMARELYELGTRYEARRTQQIALHFLADCPLIGGDYVMAERRYLRALSHARTWGILARLPDELLGVAMSIAGQGDHARAVRLAAAAHAKDEALGFSAGSVDNWWSELQERFIGGACARLRPDEVAVAERAGREAAFDAVLDEMLGALAEDHGDPAAGRSAGR
ncbi:MAG TPA: adenylate/guanylate cyclase domain-containing protein [Candidatus Limnocylindrales bacterium]|nr:adenylate/guanylate cyclase domain-containing protein [Candidatus Limnocylindrales bacterium]